MEGEELKNPFQHIGNTLMDYGEYFNGCVYLPSARIT